MFESPHAINFVECPPSNGGDLFLARTKVVGCWDFGEYLFTSEGFEILIWSIIDTIISVGSSAILFIFSS